MQLTSYLYRNNKLAAWLVGINFLLSAVLFTGYTGKSTKHYLQTEQTSGRFISKTGIVTRCIPYQEAATPSGQIKYLYHIAYTQALLTYSKTINTQFLHISSLFNSNKVLHRLTLLPPAYENDGDTFISAAIS